MALIKEELAKALQNLSGKNITGDHPTITDMLIAFNKLYTCTVTFATTPEDATVIVKLGDVVIAPEEDGTFELKEGTYKYDVVASGYTNKINQTLTISNADETTGSKTVTVAALTTCVVTFAVTPEAAELVVKQGETVIVPEENGTYKLPAGEYTYSATAEGYTAIEDAELTIAAADETTGTKTVTVTMEEEAAG